MLGSVALNQRMQEIMPKFHLGLLLIGTLIGVSYGCPWNSTLVNFYAGFSKLYGESNVNITDNGNSVYLSLDNQTGGSGFVSQNRYNYGLFRASIKLPSQNYTAGVVATFYLSNNNHYPPEQHDEIDFEFLGHRDGQDWILQTNVYGNGSIDRGREERYKLWFDPSKEFHQYTIFWVETRIMFYVDSVPIREVQRVDKMGGDYPSKPMSLYATIWDGSDWATDGGKYKINHTFDPFVAGYSELVLNGCSFNTTQEATYCSGSDYMNVCGKMTLEQVGEYEAFRRKYMTYSYCQDKHRYSIPLPECHALAPNE